jgi:membrane protease YdiL (CAAX protease family)
LLGFLLFGIVPFILVIFSGLSLNSVGVEGFVSLDEILWILGLSAVVIIMNYFAARSEDNLRMYPQIRVKDWPRRLLIKSSLTWILYLIGYEFLFRGYLLFSWEKEVGALMAISVNVALYVLVHVPKGLKEAVGALPLGILLCILTLQTGTIWIALLVHIVMALTNEWFSIHYQKNLT